MATKPKDPSTLRTGFTTGACAAAAARAAVEACLEGTASQRVETRLPNGNHHVFTLERCQRAGAGWLASVVKDAGDDPDCTHGAELVAHATLTDKSGIELQGGEGVATVTKQGLGLEPGSLAITPVPRRNVTELALEALALATDRVPGVRVQLSVPGGEVMARETLNERLGLVGGISILGTTGIVRPYSTAAYRASVVHAIDLAAAVGHPDVLLTTGGKTEAWAMGLFPNLGEDAFVQAGDFIGTAVKSCARVGTGAIVVAMIGKLSKMADGRMMTHAAGSKVNLDLLATLAQAAGADQALVRNVRAANTARHALELCVEAALTGFGSTVCQASAEHLSAHAVHAGRSVPVRTVLLGFEGEVLGTFPPELGTSLTSIERPTI